MKSSRKKGHKEAVKAAPVWLFDLDDTLHDATSASMGHLRVAMGTYIETELGVSAEESNTLRRRYWLRYGATLLGLVRHHNVKAAHFLHHTHLLPGLEDRLRGNAADLATVARLPGRKYILTNAPRAYALRVLGGLSTRGLSSLSKLFDGLISIEDMHVFGHLRPKPDSRLFQCLAAKLRVSPARCVLVEDTLEHQRSARSVGMVTVWMQRWLPEGAASNATRLRNKRRPAYVHKRVRALRDLRRWKPR